MDEAKKKLFGLFRSRSTSQPTASSSKQDERRERERDDDTNRERKHRREKRPSQHHEVERDDSPSPQRQPTRSRIAHYSRSEPRRSSGTQSSSAPQHAIQVRPQTVPPIFPAVQAGNQGSTEWPPRGYGRDASLSQGKAMEFVCAGVPVFKGHKRRIPHTSEGYHFYTTTGGNANAGTDAAEPYYRPFGAVSLSLQGDGPAMYPWETLEQPSMAFAYGTMPGTVTLNHWVGLSAPQSPPLKLRDSEVQPREVDITTILDRLIYLEGGFEDDYPDLMYKNLYKNLLRDPDKYMSPHKAIEKQITDLILVLSRKEWIDFSDKGNHVVGKFFSNATYTNGVKAKAFFHQLLLSMELDLRIQSKLHNAVAKERLLAQLPPSVAWSLAVARKWRECMKIERYDDGDEKEQIRFRLNSKHAQVKALRKFARAMKWPNLVKVDDVLKERDTHGRLLEDRSSDAMSYFSGVIMPGPTLPWLIMNSLIDCDADAGSNSLAVLTHMAPATGFQYKSTTYWSSSSIVGKVIAPTCREIGGWVGPARPAPDLGRIEIARIRQRKPKRSLKGDDMDSMTERSDPLGPPARHYPIGEYNLLLPDREPSDFVDTVRIEKLALKPVSVTSAPGNETATTIGRPLMYDAAVQFAIDGKSWPLRLSHDVSFVSATPCTAAPGGGAHPLFFDYIYLAVKVDQILTIRNWGTSASTNSNSTAGTRGNSPIPPNDTHKSNSNISFERESQPSSLKSSSNNTRVAPTATASRTTEEVEEDDNEKVLVIEAFGVEDNEVLARAWCSHWGLSAIVADVEKCCMGCAVREAFAACINVWWREGMWRVGRWTGAWGIWSWD